MMSGQEKTVKAMPGYGGHIPCMRNHVIGRAYGEATVRSAACEEALRNGSYDKALPIIVDSRPQGRDHLYAQTAKTGNESEPVAIVPKVSKRMPPLGANHGGTDVRQMKTVVGTTERCATKQYKTTSLPDLPYKTRTLQVHKHREPMEQESAPTKSIPGYTGHQHAAQHIFSRSYGSAGRTLMNEGTDPEKPTAKDLLYYADPRPVGTILAEKHKMPGYQGYIPAKDNHIYGKSAGKASELAAVAEETLMKGENAGALPDLIDIPPQGRVDLYAQKQEKYHSEQPKPLEIKVDKARVDINFLERRKDYRMKERYQDDALEVMQGRHHTNGYTGHLHASQHVYGTSYGKMTRDLRDKPANPATSKQYIDFTDTRALVDQTRDLKIG